MPEINAHGILKIFCAKSFENKEGQTVEYNEAYFLCKDRDGEPSVLKVNTKKDLTAQVDREGDITVSLQANGKLKLINFNV